MEIFKVHDVIKNNPTNGWNDVWQSIFLQVFVLERFWKKSKSLLGREERKEEYSRTEEKDAKVQSCMRSVT